MIDLLIYLAIFTIFAIVAWWVLSQLPLPPPLRQILIIALVVIGAVIIVYLLLGMRGGHMPSLGLTIPLDQIG